MPEQEAMSSKNDISMPKAKRKRFKFLRSKWFWIAAVLILGGGIWYASANNANKGPFYETQKVEKGEVIQTVEVTGEIVPEARLNLGFKSGGPLEKLDVRVGQQVKAGTVLAELESRDLRFASERARASLAIAQANLNAKLAGVTDQSIQVAKAAVAQAEASHEKAVVDLEVTKQTVEDDYQKALLTFQLAESNVANSGATADQSVVTSFENLRVTLQAALAPMRNGLVDGDAIIGIDNSSANDNYENVLGIFDKPSLAEAKNLYPATKAEVNEADALVRALSSSSSHDDVLAAALKSRTALEDVQLYLTYVQKTLAGTLTNPNLTQTQLDTLQAGISANLTSAGTQLSSLVSAYESARNSDLTRQTSIDQLQSAYDTAKINLQIADSDRTTKVKTATAAVQIQQAALDSAKATLAEREAPVRAVDVVAFRAQVLDAQTAYNQSLEKLADVQIIAPVNGTITDIIPNRGELVTANQTAVKMITTDGYTVEALVPEADIVKVEPGQSIDITLDAYGDNEKFAGTVLSENADQTKVQDAIYYKIYVEMDPKDKDVKPGMTANLTVKTGNRTNVLVIPSRSLRVTNGDVGVRVLQNGAPVEKAITIGLRGDEGRVEAMTGLEEGEEVITGERTAAEYKTLQTSKQ